VKRALFVLFFLYLSMMGYVFMAQRSFIYFPEHTKPVTVPTNYELEHAGLRLKGWVLNQESRDAIIYFGGNGESLEYNLPLFRNMFQGRAVYMLSYRGFGDSEGEPSEAGIYADAVALYDSVRTQHDSISIIGRSLGSGVATYLAVNRPTDKLVLITPYANLEGIARRKFPIFPVGLLLRDKYASVQRAKQIAAESLIIYAENDTVVPEASTRELISAFNQSRLTVKRVLGAGHNSISSFAEYKITLQEFF
jgi:uncharacterized protein